MHIKVARPEHPIQQTLSDRWSPYALVPRPIPREDLLSILEAARWAASAYNEQPWRYILATRDDADAFATALSCLVEPNQAWAANASALLLTLVSTHFTHNGAENGSARHDAGLAAGNLSVEATARGVAVHQMAGIVPDRIIEVYGVPDGLVPITGIALGYAQDPEQVPDTLKERDLAPRSRRPLNETVFSGQWGQSPDWL